MPEDSAGYFRTISVGDVCVCVCLCFSVVLCVDGCVVVCWMCVYRVCGCMNVCEQSVSSLAMCDFVACFVCVCEKREQRLCVLYLYVCSSLSLSLSLYLSLSVLCPLFLLHFLFFICFYNLPVFIEKEPCCDSGKFSGCTNDMYSIIWIVSFCFFR